MKSGADPEFCWYHKTLKRALLSLMKVEDNTEGVSGGREISI